MTVQELEKRVLTVVCEVLALDADQPTLDSSISEDLGADSLDKLSLFMALEDEFGGRIRHEDAERISTLLEVVQYVREQMSTAPAR